MEEKNKITVRNVIKQIAKNTRNGATVSIEYFGIYMCFEFYALNDNKCLIVAPRKFENIINEILDFEVEKYTVENDYGINIKFKLKINDSDKIIF